MNYHNYRYSDSHEDYGSAAITGLNGSCIVGVLKDGADTFGMLKKD